MTELAERYARNRDHYRSSGYNEETARGEFITPFFEALGWDVANRAGNAEAYKDVVHEESVKVGDLTKAPDYTFRVGGQRKFFVEAKRPFVDLRRDPAPAYQLRRYAWSAKLQVSILTDFEEFAVYDTRRRPFEKDKASVCRIQIYTYDQYLHFFDDIWNVFSKEAVYKGSFDRWTEEVRGKRGTSEVDAEFLKELEGWRTELARNLALRNRGIGVDDLNFAVQATIDRILFLRVAESRGVEPPERLRALLNGDRVYRRLAELFGQADIKYNSGLFDFRGDRLTLGLRLDDKVLRHIIEHLYYPESPYEFSVLPPEILGNVYEQFLGKVIRLTAGGHAKVEEKPEIKKAGGVYYTPSYIVDYIVRNTVGRLTEGKSPREMAKLRILDPACGSGSFLLRAYQHLLDAHLAWYRDHDPPKHKRAIYLGRGGEWRLTLAEKRRILVASIYGVDIDRQAVEVTKLSLLLAVMEGEPQSSFLERALPALEKNIKSGNSLIGHDAFKGLLFPNPEDLRRINPFDWSREFSDILENGGFDAVIGNPPYLNIDDTWGRKDIRLGLLKEAYSEIYNDKTDLLFYFIARGLQLTRAHLSFIVSRAFLEAFKADKLRGHLAASQSLVHVIDFRNFRVFPRVGITTAIAEFDKARRRSPRYFRLLRPIPRTTDLGRALEDPSIFEKVPIRRSQLGAAPWIFVSREKARLFEKIDSLGGPLSSVLHVGQGMQTGLNEVFAGLSSEAVRDWRLTGDLVLRRATNTDVQRYWIRDRSDFVLYLEDVADFRELPAGVQRYLEQHSDELRARAAFQRKDCEWWKYSWPLHKERYARQRILSPYLAKSNRFALDWRREFLGLTDTTVLFDNDQAEDLRFVLALLNSRLLTFRFTGIGKLKSGGIVEYFWNSVSKLPIRRIRPDHATERSVHDRLCELVDQATALMSSMASARTVHDRDMGRRQFAATDSEIDRLVYWLYDLTAREIEFVEKADS